MSCISAVQLKFWFQTDLGRENLASCYRQGRQFFFTLLTMITRRARVGRIPRKNKTNMAFQFRNIPPKKLY